MLSYVMNLAHIMCSKVSGKSICGSPDVERLVEIRTVRSAVYGFTVILYALKFTS